MGHNDSADSEIDDTSDAEIDTELAPKQVVIAIGYDTVEQSNFFKPVQNRIAGFCNRFKMEGIPTLKDLL